MIANNRLMLTSDFFNPKLYSYIFFLLKQFLDYHDSLLSSNITTLFFLKPNYIYTNLSLTKTIVSIVRKQSWNNVNYEMEELYKKTYKIEHIL